MVVPCIPYSIGQIDLSGPDEMRLQGDEYRSLIRRDPVQEVLDYRGLQARELEPFVIAVAEVQGDQPAAIVELNTRGLSSEQEPERVYGCVFQRQRILECSAAKIYLLIELSKVKINRTPKYTWTQKADA